MEDLEQGSPEAPEQLDQDGLAQGSPDADQELAAQMYPSMVKPAELELPPGVKEMRQADQDRRVFSPQNTYRESFTDAMLDEVEETKALPAAMRAAVLNEAREIAADIGMTVADIKTLRDLDNAIKANPPTEETRAAWREEALARIRQEFGDSADQVLKDTRKFIARDPRFIHALEINGRGDHPETVMLFARLARKARMEGKFK